MDADPQTVVWFVDDDGLLPTRVDGVFDGALVTGPSASADGITQNQTSGNPARSRRLPPSSGPMNPGPGFDASHGAVTTVVPGPGAGGLWMSVP